MKILDEEYDHDDDLLAQEASVRLRQLQVKNREGLGEFLDKWDEETTSLEVFGHLPPEGWMLSMMLEKLHADDLARNKMILPDVISAFDQKPKALKSLSKLELRLTGVKRYDGPFKKNRIDLNDRRTWNPIRAITIDLDLPPEGKEIPKPLAALVSDVQRAASEAGPETVQD